MDTYLKIMRRITKVKALIVGDFMLDEYVWGQVSRISPEAPVPVVKVQTKTSTPGGAANVVNNIRCLGAKVYACGIVGSDTNGRELVKRMKHPLVDTSGIIKDTSRITTKKTRIMAQKHQMLRIDKEDSAPVNKKVFQKMKQVIAKTIRKVDFVIIEDYGKGVVTKDMVLFVKRAAQKAKKFVAVDPKENHFELYRGITLITPNAYELEQATRIATAGSKGVEAAAKLLQKKLKCQLVLVTQGEKGMSLFGKGQKPLTVPAMAREVFDVSGAGDTVIAVFCLAVAAGADVKRASRLANLAAGIVVGKLGVAVATRQEILHRLHEIVE
ncbi:D-glycero-beta-D-manno-heptose-7-phosphate kinase [PVC group bacterium]|nr:D-glycero-beta-D-manno-heptose-7-phosphate kinase [PVC group bacterium]